MQPAAWAAATMALHVNLVACQRQPLAVLAADGALSRDSSTAQAAPAASCRLWRLLPVPLLPPASPLPRSARVSSSCGRRRHTAVPLTFFIRQSDKGLRALVLEAAMGSSAADAGGCCSNGGGEPKP